MADARHPNDRSLPHLETFAKAAELSSFTAAAKALRLTQAAVSQRMQALEAVLGKSLFQRRGGRVLLTEAGRKLYEYSQRILAMHRDAWREVTGQPTPPTGELYLAASSIPGEYLLPALLAEFHQQQPHIHVHVTIGDSMTVLGQVERGEVSLGLVGRKVANPNLVFRFLASDKMVLVAPPKHALRRRKSVTLRQLLNYPLLLREQGSGMRHSFEQALERAGRSVAEVRVALELGSNEAIKEAVLRGAGLAVMSTYAIRKERAAGKLHVVNIAELQQKRDMFIVQDRRRVTPLPAKLFLDFLETHPFF